MVWGDYVCFDERVERFGTSVLCDADAMDLSMIVLVMVFFAFATFEKCKVFKGGQGIFFEKLYKRQLQ